MLQRVRSRLRSKLFEPVIALVFFLLLVSPSSLHAQKSEEFDNYKLRFDGLWFYSNPTGSITGKGETVPVDFQRDLGFSFLFHILGKTRLEIHP